MRIASPNRVSHLTSDHCIPFNIFIPLPRVPLVVLRDLFLGLGRDREQWVLVHGRSAAESGSHETYIFVHLGVRVSNQVADNLRGPRSKWAIAV